MSRRLICRHHRHLPRDKLHPRLDGVEDGGDVRGGVEAHPPQPCHPPPPAEASAASALAAAAAAVMCFLLARSAAFDVAPSVQGGQKGRGPPPADGERGGPVNQAHLSTAGGAGPSVSGAQEGGS